MEDTKTNTVRIIIFALFIIAIVVVMSMIVGATSTSSKYTDFSQCLAQKKVKFYGAFWCPHCQEQEKWLAASRDTLAKENLYVECSTPDAKDQTQICKDKKITGYPTWFFPDGTSVTKELTLQ